MTLIYKKLQMWNHVLINFLWIIQGARHTGWEEEKDNKKDDMR